VEPDSSIGLVGFGDRVPSYCRSLPIRRLEALSPKQVEAARAIPRGSEAVKLGARDAKLVPECFELRDLLKMFGLTRRGESFKH